MKGENFMIARIQVIVLSCLLLLLISACSQSEDDPGTGEKIAKEIQKPIDKANLAKKLTEDHNREIDEKVTEK